MQTTYKNIFEQLPDSSKVWIYQSQTPMSIEDQSEIQQRLDDFVKQWAAHGEQLYGDATILEDYFIVLSVNESVTIASGCSIDSSVQFIKTLEIEFKLNLFDRLNVLIEEEGQKKIIPFSELQKHSEAFFFNPMITNLGEFRQKWKAIISETFEYNS